MATPTIEELQFKLSCALADRAELIAALERFVSLCPSNDGLGGHAPIGAFHIAAQAARATLARVRP